MEDKRLFWKDKWALGRIDGRHDGLECLFACGAYFLSPSPQED